MKVAENLEFVGNVKKELTNTMTFKEFYYKEVVPQMKKELNIPNILAVPKIKKVVINVGCGEAAGNKKIVDKVMEDILLISGQKPLITKARKSIAAFKIRRGLPIGVKVTLRGKRMYDFLEKLFKIVLPRIRDFHGIPSSSFDGKGNLNIGLPDQTLFPEIDYDKMDKIRGVEITIVTTAQTNDQAKYLLKGMGLVFEDTQNIKN